MKSEDRLKAKWIYVRDGEVRGVFDNRKEAVKYLKALLEKHIISYYNYKTT